MPSFIDSFVHELDDRYYNCVCGNVWPCESSEDFLRECSQLCVEIGDFDGSQLYAQKAALAKGKYYQSKDWVFWQEM